MQVERFFTSERSFSYTLIRDCQKLGSFEAIDSKTVPFFFLRISQFQFEYDCESAPNK